MPPTHERRHFFSIVEPKHANWISAMFHFILCQRSSWKATHSALQYTRSNIVWKKKSYWNTHSPTVCILCWKYVFNTFLYLCSSLRLVLNSLGINSLVWKKNWLTATTLTLLSLTLENRNIGSRLLGVNIYEYRDREIDTVPPHYWSYLNGIRQSGSPFQFATVSLLCLVPSLKSRSRWLGIWSPGS